MDFSDIFLASALPVLKVVLLCGVGAVCARMGLLDPAGRRTLSGLVYYVFVPALIFDKLAGAITIERLLQWWPLAVNTLVSILIGLLLGNWVANLLQPEAWFRPHTVVSVAMGNVGNLPLVLIHALAQSGAVGVAGPPEEADRLAIAYVVMGMWVASMFHFTMCFNMLKPVPGVPRPGHGLPLAGQGDDNAASSPRRRSSAAATSPRGAGRKLHRQVSDLAVADWARRMGSSVRRQFSSGRRGSADIEAAAATAVVDVDAARGSRRGEWLPLLQVNDSSSSSSAWGAKSPQQPNGGSSGPAAGRAASGDAAPPAAGSSSPSDAGGEQQHGLPSLERRSLRQSQGQGFRRLPSISEGLDKEGEQPSSPRGPEEGNSGTGGQQQSQQWALEVEGPGGRAAAGAPSSSPSSLSSSTAAGGLQGGSGGPSPPLAPSDAGSSGRPAAAGLSWLRVWEVAKGFIVQLKSPPVLSCLVSIPVGTIAPLKAAFFETSGSLFWLGDCVAILSDAAVPAMMIMIGATLEKGPGKGRVPLRVLAAITISRLLVLPIIGTVLVFGTYQLGWYDAPDEIFLMVMLVQQCAPTAMNAATMAAVLDNGDVEMSVVLFWQYVLLVLVMPLFLSLFLVLLHAWFPRGGGR